MAVDNALKIKLNSESQPMMSYGSYIAQKMKLSIKDFFSKCDQIRRFLYRRSHLLTKSLIENFIFLCSVTFYRAKYSLCFYNHHKQKHCTNKLDHTQNVTEKLLPDLFLKIQNWAYDWINNLKFYIVCFYFMRSLGLSKYIETNLQNNSFYLIQNFFKQQKKVWN